VSSSSRFSEPQADAFRALDSSLAYDVRLWPFDVAQSRAHAGMLASVGVISDADRDALHAALSTVEAELDAGEFPFADGDVDIHTAIERRVTELAGPVGGKLHTARSRNDQVATDLAMYTREVARTTRTALTGLMAALVRQAEAHLDWALPGYTHLQRGQPVYLSHHLLAYVWMLDRDRRRFAFVLEAPTSCRSARGAWRARTSDRPARVADVLGLRRRVAELDRRGRRPRLRPRLPERDRRRARRTCRAWAPSSSCGRARSSASSSCPTRGRAARRSCRRRRTPTPAELLRAKAPRIVAHLAGLYGVMHALR
jgi:argininosuccinate lyase